MRRTPLTTTPRRQPAPQVAVLGAESAVYDCLVHIALWSVLKTHVISSTALQSAELHVFAFCVRHYSSYRKLRQALVRGSLIVWNRLRSIDRVRLLHWRGISSDERQDWTANGRILTVVHHSRRTRGRDRTFAPQDIRPSPEITVSDICPWLGLRLRVVGSLWWLRLVLSELSVGLLGLGDGCGLGLG